MNRTGTAITLVALVLPLLPLQGCELALLVNAVGVDAQRLEARRTQTELERQGIYNTEGRCLPEGDYTVGQTRKAGLFGHITITHVVGRSSACPSVSYPILVGYKCGRFC